MQNPQPVTHYYIHDGKIQYGPFTYGQLCTMRIYRHTLLWRKGLPGWTYAGHLPELQAFPFAVPAKNKNSHWLKNPNSLFSLLVELLSPIGCLVLAVILLFIIGFFLVVVNDLSKIKPKKTTTAKVIYFESAENRFTWNTVR